MPGTQYCLLDCHETCYPISLQPHTSFFQNWKQMASVYFWCYYHQDLGLQVPKVKVLIYRWGLVHMQY